MAKKKRVEEAEAQPAEDGPTTSGEGGDDALSAVMYIGCVAGRPARDAGVFMVEATSCETHFRPA